MQHEIQSKSRDGYKLYMIGSKGFDYAKRTGLKIENQFMFVPDDIVYQDIKPVVVKVLEIIWRGRLVKW